jgi:cyanate lyase
MGYQEKYGNLKRLLHLSACFSSLPLQHFTGTPDNEALLEMMCKSIALDNCKTDELPADKSIYRFLELVESFLKLTERLCTDKLAELQMEVDRVKGMKGEGVRCEMED